MRLRQYKIDAAKVLEVPIETPVSQMLDLLKARYRISFEKPESKLEQARLLGLIAGYRGVGLVRRWSLY